MNVLEHVAVSVRRHTPLEADHILWRAVRPVYKRTLQVIGRHGLERTINGRDTIKIVPELYNVGETYEPTVWRALMRELRPEDVVVDVGASIGLYTLAIGRRLEARGHVYAFEPDPQTLGLLHRNVHVNQLEQVVTVYGYAVGDKAGRLPFADGQGVSSHVSSNERAERSSEVQVVTLDSMFRGKRVDVVKIDVEGFEEHVLRGATYLLCDQHLAPRAIFVEVHPFAWHQYGVTSDSLLKLLRNRGYRVEDMNGKTVQLIDEYGEVIARKKPDAL